MPIEPSGKFKEDIQGRDTQLVPLVIIGDTYYISTSDITFAGQQYLPLLDNIPSLKESINVETRKYKISSVTLNFHNAPYNGERFSEKDIKLNDTVKIRWLSPSCTSFEDSFLIYDGFVRNYKMTDTIVALSIEDKSQQIVHVEVPIKRMDNP